MSEQGLTRAPCGCVMGVVGEAFVMQPCSDSCELYAYFLDQSRVQAKPLVHAYDESLPLKDEPCLSCGIRVGLRPYGPEGHNICAPCSDRPEYRETARAAMEASVQAVLAMSAGLGVAFTPDGPIPMTDELLASGRYERVIVPTKRTGGPAGKFRRR